ncbi:MAG: type II toxin-antitoxin system RelE/ParE family toxin [Candidatus Methylacidiphilales bacterium]
MSFRFLSPALDELSDAAQFYDDRIPGMGTEFINEVDRAIDLILGFPKAWGRLSDEFRHCNLRRFPYNVIYTVEDGGEVLIVSIFHQSRAPLSWRRNT